MKDSINNKTADQTQSLISQTSNKNNQNSSLSLNNGFSEEPITPDYISDKKKKEIISNNKFYFIEYSKLYDENNLLKLKLQELILKKSEYKKRINRLESKENRNENSFYINISNNIYVNNKRKRRKRSQITYRYKCNFKNCNKKYSTESCLNQHIKLKHTSK